MKETFCLERSEDMMTNFESCYESWPEDGERSENVINDSFPYEK